MPRFPIESVRSRLGRISGLALVQNLPADEVTLLIGDNLKNYYSRVSRISTMYRADDFNLLLRTIYEVVVNAGAKGVNYQQISA